MLASNKSSGSVIGRSRSPSTHHHWHPSPEIASSSRVRSNSGRISVRRCNIMQDVGGKAVVSTYLAHASNDVLQSI
jgi:hypothetical protein